MYRKILVGYDGSDGSKAALDQALALSAAEKADVTALWVQDSLPHFPATVDEVDEERRLSRTFARRLARQVERRGKERRKAVRFEHRVGHPARVIGQVSREDRYDLVIVGHAGHSAVWRRLLGSTADRVSDDAACSVLIVRPEDPAPKPSPKTKP